MRLFIIGGTQLSGPSLVRHLLRLGHKVTIYHRGNHAKNVPAGAQQIIAPKIQAIRRIDITCVR